MKSQASPLGFDAQVILSRFDSEGRFPAYFDILRAENQKVNLVSRETIVGGLEMLAAESLAPLEQIEVDSFESYLDIGAGGGFPAIPIILAGKADKSFLLERSSKKQLALQRILRALEIQSERAQVMGKSFEEVVFERRFDLVTLRLVKITKKIVRKVCDILTDSGHFVYYSAVPEDISHDGLSAVSYGYKTDNHGPQKHFTILQKIK